MSHTQHKVYTTSALALALAVLFFCLFNYCKSGDNPKSGSTPANNHDKMMQILAETRAKVDRSDNLYSADAKLRMCDSLLALSRSPKEVTGMKYNKAGVLLELGNEAEAVPLYEQVVAEIQNIPSHERQQALTMLGTAYLRLAERNNCINGHTVDACILPIRGTGIHTDKTAARKAAETFQRVLAEYPEALDALWLLNIVYFTLGEYPESVPPQWLIPNLDKPDYPVQAFTDIAADLGISVRNRGGGSITDDFDNDGYLDIVTSTFGLEDSLSFFRNNGDGTFTDRSKQSGLGKMIGGINTCQADYNNDGWLDIFVLRGAWQGQAGFGKQPNSLLRNNGDGTFTDATIDAGLLSFYPTQTATWADLNLDGWLDLVIGNETADPRDQAPCEFFLSNRNGTFTNVNAKAGLIINAFVKGVTSGDYDNDGWPDLFFSTLNGEKLLLRNKGSKELIDFEDVTIKSGLAKEVFRSFPTWFFDYDNDGRLDIFTCNYDFDRPLSLYAAKEALHPSLDKEGKPFVFHNNGNGTFSNVSQKLGLNTPCFAMGANFGDIDNDGWLDFYLATGNPNYRSVIPNRLYKNLGGKAFAEATVSARVGHLQKGHGVSFADLDNDGDQDLNVDLGGAYKGDSYPNALYLNPGNIGPKTNNWLCLKLEGTTTNRAAIGAKLTFKFKENGKNRLIYRELNAGGSFGCSPMRREIGLGQATVVDEISIYWPVSRTTQVFKNVAVNQFFKIKEGVDKMEPFELNKIVFRRRDGSIPMCAPSVAQ